MNAAIDVSGVVLKTGRLVLRPWREEDLEDFYEYARVDGVGQMAGWRPHGSLDESREILEMFIREKKTLALVYQGKAVGSLGIEEYPERYYPELSDLNTDEITKSEWYIIQAVARGMSNKEIAETLWLSQGTVRNSISSILNKLHLRDRTQLAIWAIQTGVVNKDLFDI